MNPRNKYFNNPANFGKLGEKYPEFRKYLLPTSSGYTINFKDPKALRELTVCLLQQDFGLAVELPLDRLIPTVTLRLNYIHWIEDLLQLLPKTETRISGIDVGTGSSCIYPLLGAKINNWKFCASEIDEISYRFAIENVKRNHLEETIQVRLVTPDIVLVDLLKEDEQYDFTMCNPPFFADKSETVGCSRTGDRPRPSSVCTGSESETVTSGGEVAFVGRMIDDSLRLGSRVKWFTTMLGKKSSLAGVLTKLKQNNISNVITTEFCQGRTMRWGVAWTFLSDVVTKETPKKKRKKKPLEFTFSSTSVCSKKSPSENIDHLINKALERVQEILKDLQVQVLSESSSDEREMKFSKLHCCATHNTWANQRRKRREAAGKLKPYKQLLKNDISDVEQSKNPSRASVIDPEGLVRSDQKQLPTGTETVESENLPTDLGSVSTSKIYNRVDDSGDVIAPKYPVTVMTNTRRKHPATSGEETQNDEMKIDNNDVKSDHIEDKTSSTDRKRKHSSSPDITKPEFLKSGDGDENKQVLIEFVLTLGTKPCDLVEDDLPEMFLQMEWISGHDKNCMYQLFQYFKNRFNS